MFVKINVEYLIDALTEENRVYQEYRAAEGSLYKGPYEGLQERKKELHRRYNEWSAQRDAAHTLFSVLGLGKDQIQTLYSLTRSVGRWRKATNWEKLIPESMQEQIMRAVFGKPATPSFACAACAFWDL